MYTFDLNSEWVKMHTKLHIFLINTLLCMVGVLILAVGCIVSIPYLLQHEIS